MERKESKDSVHYFVRGLFRRMGETEKIADQKEELESHIQDHIADCMREGIDYEEAFNRAIESLGNLDELIDTITGQRKKIYSLKLDWLMQAGGIVFGTLYMMAVGIWFAREGFGFNAFYVAIPGWLGYVIPAMIKFIEYRKHPFATAMVPVDLSNLVRSSVIGWITISVACWIVNILLLRTNTFLSIIWAWMPTVGIFTWPLMTGGSAWMIKNMKCLEPAERE